MDGDQIAPSVKSERRRRLEWWLPKAVAAAAAAPTKGSDDTSKMPPGPELPEPQTSDGWYPGQLEIHKQWEAELERLNTKYNLDCFSDTELDSESNEGEQYQYEHIYETLI